MLNRKLFEELIEDFLSYYGTSILENDLAFRVWYEYLSFYLRDEDLKKAVSMAFINFASRPSPEQFVNNYAECTPHSSLNAFRLGRGFESMEIFAYEEWNSCIEAVQNKTTKDLKLSSQGIKALASVGGLEKIRNTSSLETLYGSLSKDFSERWMRYLKSTGLKGEGA